MRIFLCYLLPPLAVLITGRLRGVAVCVILTLLLWVPGVVFALNIINQYNNEKLQNEASEELLQFNQLNSID